MLMLGIVFAVERGRELRELVRRWLQALGNDSLMVEGSIIN